MTSKKMYYTNEMIEKGVLGIARQMMFDEWRPDYIVGLNRGGLFPSVLLSHFLNCNHYAIDCRLRDTPDDSKYKSTESNAWMSDDAHNGKNILIVDDINDTGETFKWILNDWSCGEELKDNVRTAVVIENISSSFSTTYNHYEINKAEDDIWIQFPWENWWE